MSLKAIILAAAITPAVADDSAGVFQLEPHTYESITQSGLNRAEVLRERTGVYLRKAATYLNTHKLIGDPDLPEEYRDILPHEAFGRFKESLKDVLREKLGEH